MLGTTDDPVAVDGSSSCKSTVTIMPNFTPCNRVPVAFKDFTSDRAGYDDIDQLPAMLLVPRSIGEIAPAHLRASRGEMKTYYEVMIAFMEGVGMREACYFLSIHLQVSRA